MEQWFSPQADESMKMEGMETCLPVHTHSQAQSQELLLTLSQVGISQQTVKNTWPVSTQMANSASTCCTSFTSRGASNFIQTNDKVMNTCTFFILFSIICVLALFILTTYTG